MDSIPIGSAVYVYKGDPFQPGPLEVSSLTLNEDPDGIPKRTVGKCMHAEIIIIINVCSYPY